MSSKIKVDSIETVSGSGTISIPAGNNLSVGGTSTFTGASTFGEIRPNNIASTSGTNAMTIAANGQVTFATNPILGSGQILEVVSSVCDGSTVTVGSGSYTFQNVSATQFLTTSFVDTTGSLISYVPPSGTTQVIYSFNYMAGFNDNHAIASHKFFIDSDEVLYGRTTHGASTNGHFRVTFTWTINIGGSADTNVGRLASWTSAKTLKMQSREYGSSNEATIHSTMYWENTGTGQLSIPTLTITAIK